jgi:VCBS repeat-containing protein
VDNGGVDTSTSQTFTITVTPQNDPPSVSDATFNVPENSAVGTIVGTVTATDPDAGDTKTYAILSGNSSGTFAINPATGQITIANNALLDFETNPTLTLIIKVTDSSNAVGTANITVNLTNVDDPLVMTLPSAGGIYVRRAGAVAVDAAASVADQDSPNVDFSGGTLRVTASSSPSDSHDRVAVANQGIGAGLISVKGSKIYFGTSTNQIGTIVSGKNGGPLVISLTSGASQTAVNALLKAVTFHNTVSNAVLGSRTITFQLSNSGGTETASASTTLKVTSGLQPPVITLPSLPVNYVNRSTAVALDGAAIVTDIDSPNFNTGVLTVTVTQGVNSNNRLSVSSTGGITLSGKDVLYNGTKIGRLTAGNNSLSVTFSSDLATPAATQALVRALTFGTASTNTNMTARIIQMTLTDGDGGKSEVASKTIFVGASA